MNPESQFSTQKQLQIICGITGAVALMLVGLYYGVRSLVPPLVQPSLVSTSSPVASTTAELDQQIPLRTIRTLTIEDVIPSEGKFIAADLVAMKVLLYQNGSLVAEYPIKTKGRPATPWETPAGLYKIQTKESNHFSSIGKVYMPYSMQFYGNYFIHGWTYYPDGTPTPFSFSGGCIKLETENAAKVFEFADVGTQVFVYDSKQTSPPASITVRPSPVPTIDAHSWLVADLDTGDVFAEHNARQTENPGYAGTLMAALVANETISLDKKIAVPEGALVHPLDESNTTPKTFLVDDLFYPLLLQTNSVVIHALASYNGTKNFTHSMNATAIALDMASTTFAGIESPENTTTAEDLYRLAWYLTNKKSFVLKIATTEEKSIASIDGSKYHIAQTSLPKNLTVIPLSVGNETRRIAVITLGSSDPSADTAELAQWISRAVVSTTQAACASCVLPTYRKLEL